MGLKEKRIELGVSQDRMSKILDIPLHTYQRIEKLNTCNLQKAHSICVVLGCTIEELFFEEKKKKIDNISIFL